MRKGLWRLTLALLLVLGLGAVAVADSNRKTIDVQYNNIQIKVDGKVVQSDVEPFILVDKGRTVVPARPLAEALGAKVGWDADTSTVLVYSSSYVESTPAGTWLRWAMPAQGFSFESPAAAVRQQIPTALLQVALPDRSLVLAVQRMAPQPGALADLAMQIAAGMDKVYGKGTLVAKQDTTLASLPAYSVTSNYTIAATSLQLQMVITRTDSAIWMVMVARSPDTVAQSQAAVDHFLATFTLG